jgi:hypothetical protein
MSAAQVPSLFRSLKAHAKITLVSIVERIGDI